MTEEYKTTVKDFTLFKKECEKWVDRLGLKDYDIEYGHDDLENMLGQCCWDLKDRWARISLGRKFGQTKPTKYEIEATAFHEVLELLMAELYTMAGWRWAVTNEDFEMARHRIVQRLINCFYPRK